MVIGHVIRDHNVHTGTFGGMLMVIGKWLTENISVTLGILTALGGLIVVILSIKAGIKKNRLLDAELKIKEHELKNLK